MSAGTNPSKGVKPFAIEVMKEEGIDISKQKPKLLDGNMAQEAYKVFTMGCINSCSLTPKDITTEWNFDDPAGKPIESYRKVRDKIKNKIKELISGLNI